MAFSSGFVELGDMLRFDKMNMAHTQKLRKQNMQKVRKSLKPLGS